MSVTRKSDERSRGRMVEQRRRHGPANEGRRWEGVLLGKTSKDKKRKKRYKKSYAKQKQKKKTRKKVQSGRIRQGGRGSSFPRETAKKKQTIHGSHAIKTRSLTNKKKWRRQMFGLWPIGTWVGAVRCNGWLLQNPRESAKKIREGNQRSES